MGYYDHKFKLSQVLDDLSDRGLPVDIQLQSELRDYIATEETKLLSELQQLIPQELMPANRKEGYKGLPKELRAALKERDLLIPKAKLDYYYTNHYDLCNELGYYVRDLDGEYGLVKVLPFNPDSAQQLIRYIEFKGYRVPLHIDTGKPTTGKEPLEKLIEEVDDDALRLVQKMRKLTKLGGTYASGDWIPGEDGRVHGTFRFGTASGQTSCTRPNIQQFPEHYDKNDLWITDIMKRVKGTIKAEPGHKLVKGDARGAHGRCQGFLAEDEAYYRLASLDLHSYNTAHYIGVEDKDSLLALDDTSLMKRLKEIKKDYEYERNAKLKRVAYLMQFGGGADKAFQILSAFESVVEVHQLMGMIKNLFPKTFIEFPQWVEREMKKHPRIISASGGCRWFYDKDLQQAIAFCVSNNFHAHVQSAGIRLYERGAFEKYEAINFGHDSWWWHPREELVDECIAVVREEMEKPSEILVNSLGAFWCSADFQVGDTLLTVKDY